MTWPTVPIVTTSMDAGTDTPPRDQIKAMADAVNEMIATPPAGGSGRLIKVTRFVAGSYTFTPDASTTKMFVVLQGPGGGGGGAVTTTAGNRAMGGGGGAGAYASFFFDSIPSGTKTITVGSGGAGGSGAGGAGGDGSSSTSFDFPLGYVSAGAGLGGASGSSVPNTATDHGAITSGGFVLQSGLSGLGVFCESLAGGQPSRSVPTSTLSALGGGGGSARLGNGAPQNYTAGRAAGVGASSYGSGGGGSGGVTNAGSAIGGGAGADGVAIVWEYS